MKAVAHSPINPSTGLSLNYIGLEYGVGVPRVVDLIAEVNAILATLWDTGNRVLTDPVKAVEYAGHNGWDRATIYLNKRSRMVHIVACDDVSQVCSTTIAASAPSFGLKIKTATNQYGSYLVLAKC